MSIQFIYRVSRLSLGLTRLILVTIVESAWSTSQHVTQTEHVHQAAVNEVGLDLAIIVGKWSDRKMRILNNSETTRENDD